jgi:2-polyprenyl-3-methyl-5-hydroxy-6-metoxy-1,4-benzoquinol methylase
MLGVKEQVVPPGNAATHGENVTTPSKTYIESNRALWNEWTEINARSTLYNLKAFRAGKSTLHQLEIEELGDVAGKSLLHLQCHFGLDTLSWARRGAQVTGVDFSAKAIGLARSLAAEVDLSATFVESNLYELPTTHTGEYDVVLASYGAIYWLPDIREWARVAAHFVKPGGTFYLAEIHPIAYIFDDRRDGKELQIVYPYFHSAEPVAYSTRGTSYAESDAEVVEPAEYGWCHSLGDTVSALVAAGLRVEFLHEHPFTVYRQLPFMKRGADGYWRLPKHGQSVPLMFSIRATKPADQCHSPSTNPKSTNRAT